ncbi:MAG: hypothetical protein OXC10_02285 [Rhodospirillaceae bacterium]|nr:hypothetical protein [Rhodospirillaceae bacterium]
MSSLGGPVYDRVPSRQLRELLGSEGILALLLEKRTVAGVGLDVHLRRRDEVDLCCGLTCLVKGGRNGGGSVRVESHRTYAGQPCASGLFRPGRTAAFRGGEYVRGAWTAGEPGFGEALARFLNRVRIAPRQTREGAVQALWSRVDEPWVVFDKEAALAYPSVRERREHLSELFSASVEHARRELEALALTRRSLPGRRDRWAMPPDPKDRLKLDQLAVDPAGNLVLVEIKDASGSSAEVYYAPFQLLQNVWEWHFALGAVRGSLRELIGARVELGLTPADTPAVTGGIRAVVGFGDDTRSDEVRGRYAQVLGIARTCLPGLRQSRPGCWRGVDRRSASGETGWR